ncbi:unnamed protein product [Didymodactylos carnosus]|uniref:Kinesin light chain n=1 Tax=Didymodactylos carnosus TaxID=1234261 RepID=A0A814WTC7_9BILA|nr:unnamed protein product [Didymodactylos carnosus]CAF3974167.1 unnamed protein product [Didymodactylos carnosus]
MLGTIFRIDKVRFDDEKAVWVIKLTMCGENENELRDEFDYYRQQMGEYISLLSLGNLLSEMGENDTCVFICASYTGLGNVALHRGEIDVALEYYSKALEMNLKTLSPYHPDIAANYINLGVAYGDKGLYDKALEYYEKALKIKLKVYGEEHADVAHVYQNMGTAYDEKNEYEMALQYYETCLCILVEVSYDIS